MYKIAVVGDYDSIYGFATLGLEICPAGNREEIRNTLRRLAEEDYGIIYITEAAAAEVESDLEVSGKDAAGGHTDTGRVRQYRRRRTGCAPDG